MASEYFGFELLNIWNCCCIVSVLANGYFICLLILLVTRCSHHADFTTFMINAIHGILWPPKIYVCLHLCWIVFHVYPKLGSIAVLAISQALCSQCLYLAVNKCTMDNNIPSLLAFCDKLLP